MIDAAAKLPIFTLAKSVFRILGDDSLVAHD